MAKPNPIPTPLDQQEIADFLALIDKTPGQGPKGECHHWTGGRSGNGYGAFLVRGRLYTATRLAYFLATGSDPGPLLICHHCDNPPCCRPEHLFAGDTTANSHDMINKGRGPTGSKNGMVKHPESRLYGSDHWTHKQPERVARGEAVYTAVMTPALVIEMRHLHAAQHLTAKQALERYPITTESQFYRIVNRRCWKHIP